MLVFLTISVIVWIALRSSGTIMPVVGSGIEAISRLMGFLLVCSMGVQFVINGVLEIIADYHA